MTKEERYFKKSGIATEAPQNHEISPTDAISTLWQLYLYYMIDMYSFIYFFNK